MFTVVMAFKGLGCVLPASVWYLRAVISCHSPISSLVLYSVSASLVFPGKTSQNEIGDGHCKQFISAYFSHFVMFYLETPKWHLLMNTILCSNAKNWNVAMLLF